MDTSALEKLASLVRYHILTMTTAAGSGHMTSSLSAVELATLLFFKYLRFNLDNPADMANDRLIFSKGHATPLYYALFGVAGTLTEKQLLAYRTFGSDLEGHPTFRFLEADAATGSLGQGLSIGAGEALAMKRRHQTREEGQENRVWVLLGDGELAEGSVWEAASFASFHKLNNLIAIVDVNRLGQSQETAYQHHTEIYQRRFDTFGWSTLVINGHDWSEINAAYEKVLIHQDGPVAIIAKTVKGKGVSFLEDKNGWHGKALSRDDLKKALAELGPVDKTLVGAVTKPGDVAYLAPAPVSTPLAPVTTYAKPVATREAFGNALVRLGAKYPDMLVLDGDVKNSTYAEVFEKKFHHQFIQCFIAEQNMVGVGVGLARRGYTPWATSFSVFFTRAHDQIRMSALSGVDLKFCGSHAGVSIGQDGPSQMGLEDIALFRGIFGSTVLSPSDPYQTEKLVEAMMQVSGIAYMRTMREATPVIYGREDEFPIGGSRVHTLSSPRMRGSALNADPRVKPEDDRGMITIIATGVTVHEALKAQKELAVQGVALRVIDCYSIKPIDEKTLKKAAKDSKKIIIAEDHVAEGGLGEAVLSVLAKESHGKVVHLAVTKVPRSGKPEELLAYEGIDAAAIIKAVKSS